MTSYLHYKQQIRTVQDANNIESWITVKGNHIPIMKGQSKEEAVKAFIEKKGGKEKGGDYVSAGREQAKREAGHEFKKRSGVGLSFTEVPKGQISAKELRALWEKKEKAGINVQSAKEQGGNVEKAKEEYFKAEKAFNEAKGSNTGGKFEVVGGSGIKHKTFETQAEAERWAKENVNKVNTSLKVVSGYKKYKEYEPRKYESPDLKDKSESSGKTTFYKNVSGKQIGSPKGRTSIENELLTEKEMEKYGFDPKSDKFKKMELGKNEHHYFFGDRFETKKPESKWSDAWKKQAKEDLMWFSKGKTAKQRQEAGYTALEIAYNMEFGENAAKNRSNLIKEVHNSGVEDPDYIEAILNNMEEKHFESQESFRKGLKNAKKKIEPSNKNLKED